MSALLQKSEENRIAALKLHQVHRFYASSVHCAYFSCLQLITHILITKGNKSEQEIDSNTSANGSHKYLVSEIIKLIEKKDRTKVNFFNSKINDLKAFRKKSDYKNITIIDDDSDRATTMSQNISTALKNIFNI